MDSKTQKLTYGAMITAIFGVLLLINRQTGNLLQEMFLYVFPIPMVAYAARYGWKNSLPVLVCMTMIAFLCGTFSAIFYAVSGAAIGLVFGARLYLKKDMTQTLLLVMLLSCAGNLLSTYALASLMGYDLAADLTQMQDTLNTMLETAGAGAMSAYINAAFIRRIFLISMIFLGIVQGFLIFEVSLLILRKLRYPVVRPKPVTSYYPPKWTGPVGIILMITYIVTIQKPVSPTILQDLLQGAGMLGVMYLSVFGLLCLIHARRVYLPSMRILGFLLPILLYMTFPQVFIFAGYFYITGGLHEYLDKKAAGAASGKTPKTPGPR